VAIVDWNNFKKRLSGSFFSKDEQQQMLQKAKEAFLFSVRFFRKKVHSCSAFIFCFQKQMK
jgi:hypothetical protein